MRSFRILKIYKSPMWHILSRQHQESSYFLIKIIEIFHCPFFSRKTFHKYFFEVVYPRYDAMPRLSRSARCSHIFAVTRHWQLFSTLSNWNTLMLLQERAKSVTGGSKNSPPRSQSRSIPCAWSKLCEILSLNQILKHFYDIFLTSFLS